MQNPRKLLIGTWKSDKLRTLETCHRYHRLTGAKKRKFGSLFGRLVLRYTRNRLYHSLRGTEWRAKYDVIAQDSESIVLRVHSDDLWKKAEPIMADIVKELAAPRLLHIHFRRRDGRQYYWIGCGSFCEWFRRQGHPTLRLQARRARARA
ncbi:hypothetical protein SBV1_2720007 [Verrucomicrobia bacterium]|nr:hypothetical protein SBV1_2720007 [Verrucomicrobiota bacterium]